MSGQSKMMIERQFKRKIGMVLRDYGNMRNRGYVCV